MRKLDKLVLKAFLGPFFLTFFVVVFILLMQNLLKYFDDLVGKDLGWGVFAEFIGYFAVYMTPFAVPLAVLLSSLMTFGNLGEHSELTAIKGAGISLTRAMRPVFFFVVIVTGITFYSNNYLAPKSALKAYALLYDIKQKKPAMDLKQGTFYSGMKNFSIKVNKKYDDGKTLGDLIIYDHSDSRGNTEVIVADSGLMYTIHNDRYLKMELYNGYYFMEGNSANPNRATVVREGVAPYSRTEFDKSELLFDLSEFDLRRTKEDLFSKDRLVRNLDNLYKDMDSISSELLEGRYDMFINSRSYFTYHLREYDVELTPQLLKVKTVRDSLATLRSISVKEQAEDSITYNMLRDRVLPEGLPGNIPPRYSKVLPKLIKKEEKYDLAAFDTASFDSLKQVFAESYDDKNIIVAALNRARNYKSKVNGQEYQLNWDTHHYLIYGSEMQRRTAQAISVLVMFIIGAPLGAIIKRGGLGVPVLISIFFFILFYVLTINGEKWIRKEELTITAGVWLPNLLLLPIGLFFLRQARIDARLFDVDIYIIFFSRFKERFSGKKKSPATS
jgi:lipopolysaccharide export system permease protein